MAQQFASVGLLLTDRHVMDANLNVGPGAVRGAWGGHGPGEGAGGYQMLSKINY